MSASISPSVPSNSFEVFYAPIREELGHVETLLTEFLFSTNPFLKRVVDHTSRLAGKRLRPALVLLFGEMQGEITPAHRVLAGTVEIIHTATLVHDDILDEALIRRYTPTVNAQWNNETSVLLGDFMMARAMRKVVELENPTVSHVLTDATCRVCEGEMKQVGLRGNFGLTEAEYYDIIGGKTAALCECACRLGMLGEKKEETPLSDAAAQYGRELGLAFQIADDLLDLLGDEAQMGKTLGSDLEKQKLTLPMIRLFAALPTEERDALVDEIRNHLCDATYGKIRALVQRHAICESVHATAIGHIRAAIRTLDVFPDSPARQALIRLAEFIIERQQ